jgi:hypothetical protein
MLARRIIPELKGETSNEHDSSTTELIRRFRD